MIAEILLEHLLLPGVFQFVSVLATERFQVGQRLLADATRVITFCIQHAFFRVVQISVRLAHPSLRRIQHVGIVLLSLQFLRTFGNNRAQLPKSFGRLVAYRFGGSGDLRECADAVSVCIDHIGRSRIWQ